VDSVTISPARIALANGRGYHWAAIIIADSARVTLTTACKPPGFISAGSCLANKATKHIRH